MAVTVNLIKRTVMGDMKVAIADVTFDSSYPTGGEVLDTKLLGLNLVHFAHVSNSAGYDVNYVPSTGKLLARVSAAAASAFGEVANATNLSTLTIRVMAYGQ